MAGGAKAKGVVPAARLPDKLSLLRDHPLFRELPPATLDHITTYVRRRSVPKGTVIFRKGDPGVGLIGVLSGAVKISVASADGRDVVLNIIREGEVFGEIALLDGRARTADATTSDRRLAPGEVFRLGEGVAYAGAVQGITEGTDSDVVILELF